MVVVIAVVGIAAVTTTAFVDNNRKDTAAANASLTDWKCVHQGVHCGGETTADIERAWVRRERAYKLADLSLLVVGAIAAVAYVRQRR